ncbi:MAG: hypothetical protein HKN33_07985 [Pyrinomonadaceae bacterium]|nr:hypothetical protein [Pyrinomonadaceae bacterium]
MSSESYRYRIYGLNISSSRKIDLLEEHFGDGALDLCVEWHASSETTPDQSSDWHQVHSEILKLYTIVTLWKSERGDITKVCFEFEDQDPISFIFNLGDQLLSVYHSNSTSWSDLQSYLVGPAMGIVMRLQGIQCLHSSAVEVDGKAIALVGYSTSGKSTLATGLSKKGAKVIADDIAVLSSRDGRFVVPAGYTKVRLRPEAADFLTDDPDSLPIVYSHRDSRYVSLNEDTSYRGDALPLSAIYILGEHSDDFKEPCIEDVSAKDKLVRLLQNTYGSYVVMDELRAKEFKALSRVAQQIPIRKLRYAHDIKTLPKQCEIILEDFQKIISQ